MGKRRHFARVVLSVVPASVTVAALPIVAVQAATPEPQYKSEVLADTPVRYYRLGDTTTDLSGSGVNATYGPAVTLNVAGAVILDPDKAIRATAGTSAITAGGAGGTAAWCV